MLQWLNRNRRKLLASYKNQYIAYNANGMIAHSENLQEVLAQANSSGEDYLIYLVPKRTASIQILPIHFRSVVRHEWLPNYSVKLKHQEYEMEATMLVDSGAEVSLITQKVGQDLGYALADSESTLLAETIGGRVEYVLRNVEMTINDHSFIAPVAWLQTDTGGEQILLGREVVFDRFNIEFRQAEEKIIFTWLGDQE
ncbi:MAG: retropepsin-like domain-containing protein [Xenococcus sp. (in: cyanobacteria)]